jgi:hypothetical protein
MDKPRRAPDQLARLSAAVRVDVREHDLGTFCSQAFSDRAPGADRGASDDSDASDDSELAVPGIAVRVLGS